MSFKIPDWYIQRECMILYDQTTDITYVTDPDTKEWRIVE